MSDRETLRGLRYSLPGPAGGTLGSLCARMCASRFRFKPRQESGANLLTSRPAYDSQVLMLRFTGGAVFFSRIAGRLRLSPLSLLTEAATTPKTQERT